jgi:hypothetical protein
LYTLNKFSNSETCLLITITILAYSIRWVKQASLRDYDRKPLFNPQNTQT